MKDPKTLTDSRMQLGDPGAQTTQQTMTDFLENAVDFCHQLLMSCKFFVSHET